MRKTGVKRPTPQDEPQTPIIPDRKWKAGSAEATLKATLNRVWKTTVVALKVRKLLQEKVFQCSQLAHYASVVANAYCLWILETHTPENKRLNALPRGEYYGHWTKLYIECMKVVRCTNDIEFPELKEYLKHHPWDFRHLNLGEVVGQWISIVGRELGTNARNTLMYHYENQEEKTLKRIPEFKDQYQAMLRLARNWPLGKCKHKIETKEAHVWVQQQRALWYYPTEDHRRGSWTHKYQMRATLIGKHMLMKLREKHRISAMSLLPLRGYGLNHLQVDTRALVSLIYQAHNELKLEMKPPGGLKKQCAYWSNHQDELYAQVMDVSKMDIPNTYKPGSQTRRWTFGHSFRTDGTAVSLTFNRWYNKVVIPSPLTEKEREEKEKKLEEKKQAQKAKAKANRELKKRKKNDREPIMVMLEDPETKQVECLAPKKTKKKRKPASEPEVAKGAPKKECKKRKKNSAAAVKVNDALTPDEQKAKEEKELKELADKALKEQVFVDPHDESDHEAKFVPVYVEDYNQGTFSDERVIRARDASKLRLAGVDPGRTALMEIVIQSEDGTQTYRHRLSKKQYYHESKMTRARLARDKWIQRDEPVQKALASLCQWSLKVSSSVTLQAYAQERLKHADPVLWNFFAVSRFCDLNFLVFRFKKRTIERFFSRVLAPDVSQKAYEAQRRAHGVKKAEHSKPPKPQGVQVKSEEQKLQRKVKRRAQRGRRSQRRATAIARTVVGYGNGNFPVAARGQAAGPLKPLRTMLAKQVKVCLMDEYRTSKVHAECKQELEVKRMKGWRWRKTPDPASLDTVRKREWETSLRIVKARVRRGKEEQLVERLRDPWSLRWCPTCRKSVVRDENSAELMLHLLHERLEGRPRPECLSRGKKVEDKNTNMGDSFCTVSHAGHT